MPGTPLRDTLTGDLGFDDVWLDDRDGAPLLRGIDLRVVAGERVAVLGPPGSTGPSSLAVLLSRLCDPVRGRVLIGGVDVRDLGTDDLLRHSAVVLRDNVLLPVSVRDNIAFGSPHATPAEVEAAARLAGLPAVVRRLPQGYDTVVGDAGVALSRVERELVAIARTALRRAPVVILDEAMTGLDPVRDADVYAALGRLTATCTTLVISHDLGAALTCDRAVWIEDGVLVDDGSPVDVLDRQAGCRV